MSKLKIYKASAGSGKTHTLTEEYLKLAARFPENFKRVLAVTFTNKAAEEMKLRILESLNEIVLIGSNAPFYSVFSESGNQASELENRERARQLRDSILHNYSFFSLSTIDSFVQKVIKSFTYEIGIDTGYRIELDTDKVLKDLTELLYKQIDNDKELRAWLINFANYKMEDGQNWDFRGEINKIAREVFKEQFQALGTDQNETDFEFIRNYFEQMVGIKKSFEKDMRIIGEEASAIFHRTNYTNEDLGKNLGYLIKFLTISIVEQIDSKCFEPNATILKMLDCPDNWCAKSASASLKSIANELYQLLNPVFKIALAKLGTGYRFYLSALNILSAFHAFGILSKLAALLPQYRADNNLLMISDTTQILKEIIAGNEAPFIYEKIGNRYKHVLIDEFQDTSGFQWENFKPLVKNGLAEGNENLIVGDIKQSIYRWRGGDWNILMNKLDTDIGTEYIRHLNLETNWRSKKNILDFNNSLFNLIPEMLQSVFDNEVLMANNETFTEGYKDTIKKAYHDVIQKLPNQTGKLGGRVYLKLYKKQEGERTNKYRDKVKEDLPATIDQLLVQKNYMPGDIAILVRRNSEGREVANLLLHYQQNHPGAYPYQIISSESLMLNNSPVVQVLINAMYFLSDQKDSIHYHALIVAFEVLTNNAAEFEHIHFDSAIKPESLLLLPELFLSELENLKKQTIYDISENLSRIFELTKYTGQLAYLRSFLDIVLEFGQNETVDLASFLDWWKIKGNTFSLQLSDQQDAVKILSIHKSKGLAFKIVIIPYCDWPLRPNASNDNIIWTSTDIPPFNMLKRIPLIYRNYLSNSIFSKEFFEEMLFSMIDALNMLYVAFTRPKEELIVFAPQNETSEGKFSSVADLLFGAIKKQQIKENLISLSDYFDSGTQVFELKTHYNDIDEGKYKKEPERKSTFTINQFSDGNWNSKISILDNADKFFKENIEYIKAQIDYGVLMHEIFSRIITRNDLDNLLDSFYFAGKMNSDERLELTAKVEEMISRPVVSDWFSDKWNVKTEEAILDITGKIRIPDRVLFGEKETVVIDFKFGKKYNESMGQVKEYMGLLDKMNYPAVKGYIYYAEKNEIIEVR
jgi:ATP-dependent helicase/nuclease subunit A